MTQPKKFVVHQRPARDLSHTIRMARALEHNPPMSEPVVPDSSGAEPSAEGVWKASSFELHAGLQVTDFSDTLPNDVFDELFNK